MSVGDIAHVGGHSPNVAAVYHYDDQMFALPIGFDLVWTVIAFFPLKNFIFQRYVLQKSISILETSYAATYLVSRVCFLTAIWVNPYTLLSTKGGTGLARSSLCAYGLDESAHGMAH